MRQAGDDFLAFVRRVEQTYPEDTGRRRLARRAPCVTFHLTPTSGSWLNRIETWFGSLTRRALQRGSFQNVRVLCAAIERFTREWNAGAAPFSRVKTADEILAKAVGKRPAISESGR